ncbi:hypothetical protein [Amycolatopsis lexingtonensis]|uniref:hypothetical protein n=1 Tax=Amycolatopsis lexingtonensis TaxID=218822 RepID=UPI003F705B83
MWMVIGSLIVVAAMLCGTKIMIEYRRERRRESRDQQRIQTSVWLPGGSKLAGIDADGKTIVVVRLHAGQASDAQEKHGWL